MGFQTSTIDLSYVNREIKLKSFKVKINSYKNLNFAKSQ